MKNEVVDLHYCLLVVMLMDLELEFIVYEGDLHLFPDFELSL